MTITFVNLFTVAPDRDEDFLALWQEVNTYMRAKPGYVSHKLHRAQRPDATHRFANIVSWASVQDWAAAHDNGFQALVGDPAWQEFPSLPCVYDVVHEGHAAATASV